MSMTPPPRRIGTTFTPVGTRIELWTDGWRVFVFGDLRDASRERTLSLLYDGEYNSPADGKWGWARLKAVAKDYGDGSVAFDHDPTSGNSDANIVF